MSKRRHYEHSEQYYYHREHEDYQPYHKRPRMDRYHQDVVGHSRRYYNSSYYRDRYNRHPYNGGDHRRGRSSYSQREKSFDYHDYGDDRKMVSFRILIIAIKRWGSARPSQIHLVGR